MTAAENAAKLLSELNNSGYDAYLVGGCVRDTLMGREIHDYDITTNALPEEIMAVFADYRVIPTGLKHGTVTVLSEDTPFEITTYRVDGDYSDSRRPDSVRFTSDLVEDLARRDFTMNAIAMDINGSLFDPFGGAEDIKNRVIRCVGSSEKRFSEDALRIMRAIRFASVLGFSIAPETAAAIHGMHGRLELISKERIRTELDKLLCGESCVQVLLEYTDAISGIIPEIKPCIGFCQHSDYHKYDVWEHTVRAIGAAAHDDLLVRRALLFHDIAKPSLLTIDENGKGHFKGHAEKSAVISAEIMKRLRYDNKSIEQTAQLVHYHREKIKDTVQAKKVYSKIGGELFYSLAELKKADNSAKNPFVLYENDVIDQSVKELREYLENGGCCTLSQLEVKGNDLLAAGINGREIGTALNRLLELVIEGKLPNNKAVLLDYINGGN